VRVGGLVPADALSALREPDPNQVTASLFD
jgi:hypothetical protein